MTDKNRITVFQLRDPDLGLRNTGLGFYSVHLVRTLNDSGEQMLANRAFDKGWVWSNPNKEK